MKIITILYCNPTSTQADKADKQLAHYNSLPVYWHILPYSNSNLILTYSNKPMAFSILLQINSQFVAANC